MLGERLMNQNVMIGFNEPGKAIGLTVGALAVSLRGYTAINETGPIHRLTRSETILTTYPVLVVGAALYHQIDGLYQSVQIDAVSLLFQATIIIDGFDSEQVVTLIIEHLHCALMDKAQGVKPQTILDGNRAMKTPREDNRKEVLEDFKNVFGRFHSLDEKGVKWIFTKATAGGIVHRKAKAILLDELLNSREVIGVEEGHCVGLHWVVEVGRDDIIQAAIKVAKAYSKSTIVGVGIALHGELLSSVPIGFVFHDC